MRLNDLSDRDGARKERKRVGRGQGSGTGKTAGRGVKGQKSRSGVAIKGFEGGQMPIHRRLPKRGFNNIFAKSLNEVNIGRIQTAIDAKKLDGKKAVTVQALVEAGVLRRVLDGVRLLANGEITTKISFEVSGASKSAIAAVEKAGGSVTIVEFKQNSTKKRTRPEPKDGVERIDTKKAANKKKSTRKPAAKKGD